MPPFAGPQRVEIDDQILRHFEGRILAVDMAVALRCARLQMQPNQCPVLDGLIAATALVHGMTVVTRNVADFEASGVQLVNPWTR